MADIGHNSDRAQFEDQVFLNSLRAIKDIKSSIAGEMGEAADVYDRLKRNGGFTKADVKWAMELEDKDSADVIATMKRRIRIAKLLGHGLARQFEMFDEDRTPADERAYQEGLAAGRKREANSNPYAGGEQHNEWQRGFNEGTAIANSDLAAEFASEKEEPEGQDAELLKGDAGEDGDEGSADHDPFADGEAREATE